MINWTNPRKLVAKDDQLYYRAEDRPVLSNGKWIFYEPLPEVQHTAQHTFWCQLRLIVCEKALASPERSFCFRRGMKWADHDAKLPDLDRAFNSLGMPFTTHQLVDPRYHFQVCVERGQIDALLVGSGIKPGETNYGFDPSFVLPLVKAGFELRWSRDTAEAMSVWVPAVEKREAEPIGAVMAVRVPLV